MAKRAVAQATSIPAPIGGWNARDSLADMEPSDAVTLQNFWPQTTSVLLRKGHTQFSTGLGAQVETLLAYSNPTINKLFGVAGTKIYDCSAGGAVGAAAVSGLTNARWQSVNISTSGGNYLYAVNGADKPELFDGTNWTAIDGVSTPAITGVTTTLLVHVNLFKTRLWFTEVNSLRVWYLPVNSVGGAANSLDFSSIARNGGYLVAMGTWTIDAGYGVDDLAVFVTSKGEVIVYRGTDPTSTSTLGLVGVWQLGAPIGRRCFFKWAGDLLLITQDGVVPLSSALQSSRLNPKVALTDKIQSAMSSAATNYGSTFGWQLFYYAKANMLILNVPVAIGSQEQYAMNTITKAWCDFSGIAANCWELFADEPYFGGNGFVGKFWNGTVDNVSNIAATGKQAFNYFGARGQLKRYTMMRPILSTNGAPDVAASINVDFDDTAATSLISYGTGTNSGALWDSGKWDVSIWGGSQIPQQQWQGVNGVGYCAAPRLQVSTQGITVEWFSTDITYERGSIL